MSGRCVIVGGGPVGSALARRLAERGMAPICFAPPAGTAYSSHDDSGRITRILDGSPTWARLAARAIDGYSGIEARSGVRFHHPVGVLWSARSAEPLRGLDAVGSMFAVDTGAGLGGWGGIAALDGDETLLERGAAGYIAPKDMVRAHRTLAERAGASFDDRAVGAIVRAGDRWELRLSDGGSVTPDRVVIAAGAGSRELVDLDLEVTGETVIDAQVTGVDGATSLAGLPCIGRLSADSIVEGYLTPPMGGAHGWSIKFGAELPTSVSLTTASDVIEWMGGTEHESRLPAMAAALRDLLPGLRFGSIRSRACIYTRTRSGLPIVDEVDPGLFVATGGNGRMAKSADAVAALAADMIVGGEWLDSELDPALFAS